MIKYFLSLSVNDPMHLGPVLNGFIEKTSGVSVVNTTPAQGALGQLLLVATIELQFKTEEEKNTFVTEMEKNSKNKIC